MRFKAADSASENGNKVIGWLSVPSSSIRRGRGSSAGRGAQMKSAVSFPRLSASRTAVLRLNDCSANVKRHCSSSRKEMSSKWYCESKQVLVVAVYAIETSWGSSCLENTVRLRHKSRSNMAVVL